MLHAFFWVIPRRLNFRRREITQHTTYIQMITDPHPLLRNFKLRSFRLRHFPGKWKNCKSNVSEKRDEFFLAVIKTQWDEGDGRIPLGDNTGGGTVMLWPIRYQCVEVWISSGLGPTYKELTLCTLNYDLNRAFRKVTTAQVAGCLYGQAKQGTWNYHTTKCYTVLNFN